MKINRSVTGCSLWTRKANTAAENGVFYGLLSESDCTAVCLTSSSCVAVDLGPHGCVLHNSSDDLATAYNAPGVTQLVLNRRCLPTTSTATVAAENYTESIGIDIIKNFFLFYGFANVSRNEELLFVLQLSIQVNNY